MNFTERTFGKSCFLIPIQRPASAHSSDQFIYQLSEVARVILNLSKEGKTELEISKVISQEFDVSEVSALKDTTEFLAELHDEGLID